MKTLEYLKKNGEVAEVIFQEKVGWSFESLDDLSDYHKEIWNDCVLTALHIFEILNIKAENKL